MDRIHGKAGVDELLALLPNLVYEARVNLETEVTELIYASDGGATILGLDLTGDDPVDLAKQFYRALHPDDREQALRLWLERSRDVQSYRAQYRVVLPNGIVHWVDSRAEPTREARDRVLWRGVVTDITDLRVIARRLERSHADLARAEQLARMGSWSLELATGRGWWSDGLNLLFKRDPSLPAPPFAEHAAFLTADGFQAMAQAAEACQATGQPYRLELEAIDCSGERFFIDARGEANRDETGQIVELFGTVQDVTERREARLALRVSEARWQTALDSSGIGLWDWDVPTRGIFYSHQFRAMLGYDDDELPSTIEGWSDLVHPDDVARVYDEMARYLAGDGEVNIEHRLRAKDGSYRWILSRGRVLERGEAGIARRVIGTHTDITESKEAERSIRSLHEQLQLALEAGGVGTWHLDIPDGRFIWDDQMYALNGIEPAAFHGTLEEWLACMHPDDAPRIASSWRRALAATGTWEGEARVRAPEGGWRHIHAMAHVIAGPDGTAVRALGTNWDVTAARDAAKVMRAAKEAAEEAERTKGEFLAIMSHEIRSPMNAVLGMVRLALQTELTPRQHNYLSKIDLSAQALIVILDDILDLSRIEARKLRLEQTEFALASVLESVAAVTAVKAEEKQLDIAFNVAADVPERIVGDSLRLGQILINLVNNAVKFTERGEVIVTIATAADRETAGRDTATADRDALRLLVAVRDTGIGLDPDQIDGLFQPFTQAATHTTREYGGSGLGLAICKQLVEMMGGRIWATSEPGRGSTFSFVIDARRPAPLALPTRAAGAAPQVSPRGRRVLASGGFAALTGRRVLIVDDNALNREVAMEFLFAAGMRVDVAIHGRDALARLTDQAYDVILMDVQMPEMDGLAAARAIRQEPRWATLPIIALTAQAQAADRDKSVAAGMNAHLTKPLDERALYSTLMQVLYPQGVVAQAAAAEPSAVAPASSPGMDLTAALTALGGRPDRVRRVLESVVRDFAAAPAQLADDWTHRRREPIARTAHTVKSAAAYLGAKDLSEAAQRLEEAVLRGEDAMVAESLARFRGHLEIVLRVAREQLARTSSAAASPAAPGVASATSSGSAPPGRIDEAIVMRLIEEVVPLVHRGEYAALALLDELGARLAGTPHAALAATARDQFEELELEATDQALATLRADIAPSGLSPHV